MKRSRMRLALCVVCLAATSALAACASESPPGGDWTIEAGDREPASSAAEAADAELFRRGGDVDAQNCVYIEWCNEPGPAGTICRVRSQCQNQCVPGDALFAECDADAEAVCGGIVAPEAMRGC